MLGKTHTHNVSKLSKSVEKTFNHPFPQKQPCSNIMLKIDNGLIRKER
jgi:hypothetical protein